MPTGTETRGSFGSLTEGSDMTLALGIVAKDGIVLAADRWTTHRTTGEPILTDTQKVHDMGNGLWIAHAADQTCQERFVRRVIREDLGAETGRDRLVRATEVAVGLWRGYFRRREAVEAPRIEYIIATWHKGEALMCYSRSRDFFFPGEFMGHRYAEVGWQEWWTAQGYAPVLPSDLTSDAARDCVIARARREAGDRAKGIGPLWDIVTIYRDKDPRFEAEYNVCAGA